LVIAKVAALACAWNLLKLAQSRAFHKRRPHFLARKNFEFFELMVCPHGQGEGE